MKGILVLTVISFSVIGYFYVHGDFPDLKKAANDAFRREAEKLDVHRPEMAEIETVPPKDCNNLEDNELRIELSCRLPNGGVFHGKFFDFNGDGLGGASLPDSIRYVGDFSGFRPHGNGEMTFSSGSIFIGSFVLGIPNGHGILKAQNGDTKFVNVVNGSFVPRI